ncbi:hypothetical protein B0H14DRAFT_2867668, partial [Mycena olivaceomarginata]
NYSEPLATVFLVIHQMRHIYTECVNPSSPCLGTHLFSPPLPVNTEFDLTPGAYYQRYENIRTLRHTVLFQARDTPTCALYRLYDAICMQDEIETKHEATYIWHRHTWRLSQWPDPCDPDPDRYNMLAAIVEELVRAFNWRLKIGWCRNVAEERRRYTTRAQRLARTPQPPESVPGWTSAVPPAQQTLVLMSEEVKMRAGIQNDAIPAPPTTAFDHRNILALSGGFSSSDDLTIYVLTVI